MVQWQLYETYTSVLLKSYSIWCKINLLVFTIASLPPQEFQKLLWKKYTILVIGILSQKLYKIAMRS